MTEKDFEKLLEARTWWIHRVLNMKASEYAKEDILYNFKRAAEISRAALDCLHRQKAWGNAVGE